MSLADDSCSLSALLSQALTAFTIEFDNEFEHRAPHRTTNFSSTPGAPWLVSMVMWVWILRFVPEQGIGVQDLQVYSRSSAKTMQNWLIRLIHWWGYLSISPPVPRASTKKLSLNAIIRLTSGGLHAIAVWRTLAPLIEDRWRIRYGAETINELQASLNALASQLDPALPGYLPILGHGLFTRMPDLAPPTCSGEDQWQSALPALLSRVLAALAIEFESQSSLSLAICANVLRLVSEDGIRMRELPVASGVSREAINAAVNYLKARGCAILNSESSGRAQMLTLTAKGRAAQQIYKNLLVKIEDGWASRYGESTIRSLRESLEALVGKSADVPSPLLQGLQSYPDNWRAAVAPPASLPHYPMVSHRGGYPDGS